MGSKPRTHCHKGHELGPRKDGRARCLICQREYKASFNTRAGVTPRAKVVDGMKRCPRCGEVKPVGAGFRHRSGEPGKWEGHCRRCKSQYRCYGRPLRHKARLAVRNAVVRGLLVRQPCEVCGAEKVHAHHDDYTKPLQVRWLCQPHHAEWHRHNTPIYPESEPFNVHLAT